MIKNLTRIPDPRQQLKTNNIQHCGATVFFIDPATGKLSSKIYFCGQFRECPNCLSIRAANEKAKIQNAIDEIGLDEVGVIFTDLTNKKHTTALSRDGHLYRKFPTTGGKCLIIHTNLDYDGAPGDCGRNYPLMRLSFKNYCLTPKGKQLSGRLGCTPDKPKKEGISEVVRQLAFSVETPKDMSSFEIEKHIDTVLEIYKKSIGSVDIGNIQVVIDDISSHLSFTLRQAGLDITFKTFEAAKVFAEDIDWI